MFKRKVVKGRGQSRAREADDFLGVSLFAEKRQVQAPKVVARFVKKAEESDVRAGMDEDPTEEVVETDYHNEVVSVDSSNETHVPTMAALKEQLRRSIVELEHEAQEKQKTIQSMKIEGQRLEQARARACAKLAEQALLV